MSRFLPLLGFLFMSSWALSQSISSFSDPNWVELNEPFKGSANAFLATHKAELGLQPHETFELIRTDDDLIGMKHHRYALLSKGIPVEGAQYIVHEKGNQIIRANGGLVLNVDAPSEALIDAPSAIAAALIYTGAKHYYWDDPHKEALIKQIKDDESATFYPQPTLVYADRTYSQNAGQYRLAWKMDVFAEGPIGNKTIFVDARDGHILFRNEQCQHVTVPAQTETRYHGLQTMMVDSVAPDSFRLRDFSRAADIITLNMEERDRDSVAFAVDFWDFDNFWDNDNEAADNAATDVHWGMQQTYDYFANEHGRFSYDGDTSPIYSYVHMQQNWFNASWTGAWAQFGDGNGDPLTSLDIVSHELTHGVTGTSAGLVYRNEPGALNESFSDIFGVAVDFYATQDSADWYMGLLDFQFRNISNPKDYGHPDTYFGDNWYTEEFDNGGVHTNSGVQNYWFYLLSEGGSGTNDNGDEYNLQGIGMEKAAAIAFRNLTTYLTVNSQYIDARQGAIMAAEDLYGACSDEVLETIRAWYAVGVGPEKVTTDFQILPPTSPITESCDLTDAELLTIGINYIRSGCRNTVPAGSGIPIGYKMNGQTFLDTIILSSDIVDGDMITYTFPDPIDMSEPDFYDFEFFINLEVDENPLNDVIQNYTVSHILVHDTTSRINFDWFNRPPVPLYNTVVNRHSEAFASTSAASSGFRGFLMTGKEVRQNNITPPLTEEENFTLNRAYESRMCSCVDATNFDSVQVSFDLLQGYAGAYADIQPDNPNVNLAIAMRLIADEIPVSQQFHPDTFTNDTINIDTFVRHTVPLHQLAGTYFNLCFQGKHFFGPADDFVSGQGDFTYIDNVLFEMKKKNSSTNTVAVLDNMLQVFPNPASEMITVSWEGLGEQPTMIRLLDIAGKSLYQSPQQTGQGVEIDVRTIPAGMYFIEATVSDQRMIKKIIIN